MFIKRDTRKILQILHDDKTDHSSLNFSRRAAEFGGSTEEFFSPAYAPKFSSTKYLNLYKNQLQHIVGISNICRANAPIEIMSLGCNALTSLPNSFIGMHSLRELWLDNNQFEVFPEVLCEMKQLQVLVLSNNKIKDVPRRIRNMHGLEDLSLDSNDLSSLPSELFDLPNLRALRLRGNKLTQLPKAIGNSTSLETLVVGSNKLKGLPKSLGNCSSLKTLTVNSNELHSLPATLASSESLQRINAANNKISFIPLAVLIRWRSSFPKEITDAGHLLLLKYIETHILPIADDLGVSVLGMDSDGTSMNVDLSGVARDLSESFRDTGAGSPDKNTTKRKEVALPDVSHMFSPSKRKKFALSDEVAAECIAIAEKISNSKTFTTDYVHALDLDLTPWLQSVETNQRFHSPPPPPARALEFDSQGSHTSPQAKKLQGTDDKDVTTPGTPVPAFQTPVKGTKAGSGTPKSLLSAVRSPFTPVQGREEVGIKVTLLLDGNPLLTEASLALSSIQESLSTGINTLTESEYELPLVAEIRKKLKK